MRASDLADMRRVGHVDARSDHVVEGGARFGERTLDDREADPCLVVGAGRRIRVARHDRRRACDEHAVADPHRPRVADPLFEGRPGRDALALHTDSLPPMQALRQVDDWPCEQVAVAVAGRADAVHGAADRVFHWASVTKLATAVAVLVAAEEGLVDLDEPAGPPGSTLRHLLAHASGLPFAAGPPVSPPGRRRVYSNYGFEVAAELVAERAEMPFGEYFAAVWAGAGIELTGSPGSAAAGTIEALLAVGRELLAPGRLARETLDEATAVQFPGLAGVLPGFGRQDPNDWGLGFELRDAKAPHWTGSRNSPRTFGHFGRSGTFLWVDPVAGLALACLTDRPFGPWAAEAWPRLADGVLGDAS